MGINKFSDVSFDEFLQVQSPDFNIPSKEDESWKFLGSPYFNTEHSDFEMSSAEIPNNFDWRDHIKMTSVKDQKNCGSCYAFATLGAIESLIYRQTRQVVDLSEQEIIDCGRGYYIAGCNGGSEAGAIEYISQNGLSYEHEYPYTGERGPCRRNETTDRYQATFTKLLTPIKPNSETTLMRQLLLYGPVIISIDHLHESFMRYSSGIYYESNCKTSGDKSSHIVMLTGYGSEKGQDYWIIKNSFGQRWGEKGYFRLARNRNNHCLIATEPFSLDTNDATEVIMHDSKQNESSV